MLCLSAVTGTGDFEISDDFRSSRFHVNARQKKVALVPKILIPLVRLTKCFVEFGTKFHRVTDAVRDK